MKLYDLSNVRALVVDDNRFMRSVVVNILKNFGVDHIAQANNGDKAFQEVKELELDLIFTDWEMEKVSGFELVTKIREDRRNPNHMVPIIMITANTFRENVLAARDAGVTEFLAKPISAMSVYRRVLSVIESPRVFVNTEDYFGPDRRRRDDPEYTGPDRREDTEESQI